MITSRLPAPKHASFPESLTSLREALSLTEKELASLLGVSGSMVRRWKHGTARPRAEVLEVLIKMGLKNATAEWTNAATLPRRPRETTVPRDFSQLDLLDPQVKSSSVRRPVHLGDEPAILVASPYVEMGPPDQQPFFDKLIDLQIAAASHQELNHFVKRLSCVEMVEYGGDAIFTAQHLLERPRRDAVHWNTNYGPHGWHRYVGRFPPHLIRALLNAFGAQARDTVCDPFMGSGTVATECRLLGIPVVGTEICPLSALISRVKASFPATPGDVRAFAGSVDLMFEEVSHGLVTALGPDFTVPDVIAISDGLVPDFPNASRWFTPDALLGILVSLKIAHDLPSGYYRDMLLVAISARMRSIGNMDVDVVRAEYSDTPRKNVNVRTLLHRTLQQYGADIDTILSSHLGLVQADPEVDIRTVDARRSPWEPESVSFILTSPPYGVEASSYLRTHLLSYRTLFSFLETDPYKSVADFIGSEYHNPADVSSLDGVANLTSAVARRFFTGVLSSKPKPSLAARAGAMVTFFSDMTEVIREMHRVLRPSGRVALVIGDKRIGTEVVPSARILTEIFESEGFRLDATIAHKLKCNNSNSQVPWQERIIQDESVLLLSRY